MRLPIKAANRRRKKVVNAGGKGKRERERLKKGNKQKKEE